MSDDYQKIAKHYDNCLTTHGDTPRGMDWPNIEGMMTRYKIMADLIRSKESCKLLDLGCGTGAFHQYLTLHNHDVWYVGADINKNFIDLCKQKYPKTDFTQIDILSEEDHQAFWKYGYDYVVMNGIFTVKRELTQDTMLEFLSRMLLTIWPHVNDGMAFNVMSKQVAWERDDLFHLSCEQLASFICNKLGTRNFTFRNYGLYEYTTYVYK
jgi:SAM-dependent methyltransferase